jgi:hypothetical protein
MFCPKCQCEFVGWTDRCPTCGIPLVEERPFDGGATEQTIIYEELVGLVVENGGQLEIELSATDIGTEKAWSFPFFGYGFAWTKTLQGSFESIPIYVATTSVGRSRKQKFPYLGYGFAWARKMQGHIGGNQFAVTATQVEMERKWRFPYLGHGYAWAQEMAGMCGEQLWVDLSANDVGRRREWGFPYQGYGFAWANRFTLRLTVKRSND